MKTTLINKLTALFIILLITSYTQAQRVSGNGKVIEKTRQVGNFDQVGVSGSFDVFLVKGTEGKVELSVEQNLEPYLDP